MNPQSTSDIIYRPLDSNSHEFRLLKLLNKNGDLPSCELFHSSLNEKTEYEALSYPWGDSQSQGKIRLNGKVHLVTQNLARALADVRWDHSSRILWVDALCIDQGNLQERNHQVKQMGRIYQSAKRVVVWLGRSDHAEDARESNGLSTLRFLNDILLAAPGQVNANAMHRLRISIKNPDHWGKWHELAVLCELPYWSRLWIVQEIGLASSLEVYHGQSSIDWGTFGSIREILAEIVQRELCPQSFLPVAKIILESMPSRLEKQRAHQRPVWLKKLHDDLQLITNTSRSALSSASTFLDLWKAAPQLSQHERESLGLANSATSLRDLLSVNDQFSEDGIWLLLDKIHQNRNQQATHQSIEANDPKNSKFDSEFETDILNLPSRLEHVRDHQREEFDRLFLQRVSSLQSTLGFHKMPTLDFVHHTVFVEIRYKIRDCGDRFPHLKRLVEMKSEVDQFFKLRSTLLDDLLSIPSLLTRHRSRQQPAFRLHTLLEDCERSLCQEPRDKVYGLLGLASNVNDGEISVDYSKPMFELYEDIITHHKESQDSKEFRASSNIDLVRFSQLLQRSLDGPFQKISRPRNDDPDLLIDSTAGSTIRMEGFLGGPILPLEASRRLEIPAYIIEKERMTLLKSYFRGSVDLSILPTEISKTLSQLQAVDRERIVPHNLSSCSISNQSASKGSPHLNHLRLFSEASGLIGIARSNIREDDLLCLFANCDVACIVRPMDDHYKIIGRAVVAKRFGGKEQRVSSSSPELFQYHVPEASDLEEKEHVSFEIDALVLQELTCPTSRERREYNFSTPQLFNGPPSTSSPEDEIEQ